MRADGATHRVVRLLSRLCAEPGLVLEPAGPGRFGLPAGGGRPLSVPADLVGELRSAGLLRQAGRGYCADEPARAWLARYRNRDNPHLGQHADLAFGPSPDIGGKRAEVLVNRGESPVAKLSRRSRGGGKPFLSPAAVTAAERLRSDFERGQLQPRLTADWSAQPPAPKRSGASGGVPDLTDSALAARNRFNDAMSAVGPELSGVLVDVCCFLKGLEQIERDRSWPARSAKLVLAMALAALARHYGLDEQASGRQGRGKVRHWGADGYRPRIHSEGE